MGNLWAKSAIVLPMNILVKRLDEYVIPDEREAILDFLEMIENKLELKITAKVASTQFQECQGVPIVLKIMKRMLKDEVALRLGVSIFEAQQNSLPIIMEFIQFGGLELLQAIMRDHPKDDFLSISVPKLLKVILIVGAGAAMKEIHHETLNLQLCQKCQETMERARRSRESGPAIKIPRSCDRISRVLMFMDNYPTRKEVVCAGLDACILFARNADGPATINETDLIPVSFQSFLEHSEDADVVWRVCLLFAIVGLFTAECSNEIAKTEIHDRVVEKYSLFKKDCRVQQQILWMLGSLLKWPKSRIRIQQSEKCMNLFKYLAELRTEFLKKKINNKEKFKAFEVVAPLSIRTFLRESRGEHLVEAPVKRKVEGEFSKRRNYDENPRYGTVDDTIFSPGESGLIEEVKRVETPPWNANFQYGETGIKRNKPFVEAGATQSTSSKVLPA